MKAAIEGKMIAFITGMMTLILFVMEGKLTDQQVIGSCLTWLVGLLAGSMAVEKFAERFTVQPKEPG